MLNSAKVWIFFCTFAFKLHSMIENELKARLQHAVEHTDNNTQYPANDSVPLNGEIVFNNTRTNFKVGNGSSQYSALSNFLPPISTETWTFVFSDGTTTTKTILMG